MSPGAYLDDIWSRRHHSIPHGSTVWTLIIAIVFLAIATLSFAVDQTVTLSSLPKSLPVHLHLR